MRFHVCIFLWGYCILLSTAHMNEILNLWENYTRIDPVLTPGFVPGYLMSRICLMVCLLLVDMFQIILQWVYPKWMVCNGESYCKMKILGHPHDFWNLHMSFVNTYHGYHHSHLEHWRAGTSCGLWAGLLSWEATPPTLCGSCSNKPICSCVVTLSTLERGLGKHLETRQDR